MHSCTPVHSVLAALRCFCVQDIRPTGHVWCGTWDVWCRKYRGPGSMALLLGNILVWHISVHLCCRLSCTPVMFWLTSDGSLLCLLLPVISAAACCRLGYAWITQHTFSKLVSHIIKTKALSSFLCDPCGVGSPHWGVRTARLESVGSDRAHAVIVGYNILISSVVRS